MLTRTRRMMRSLLYLILLAGTILWNVQPPTGFAAAPQRGLDELMLSQFGVQDETLHGPYSQTEFYLGMPSTWNLEAGAELRLDVSVYYNQLSVQEGAQPDNRLAGLLDVIYNGQSLGSVPLDQRGAQTLVFPIPYEALTPSLPNHIHSLVVKLTSEQTCLFNLETSVVVRASSRIYLPHDTLPFQAELTRLPFPFYQPYGSSKAGTALVIPDNPSQAELTAALNVSAAMSRLSWGSLNPQILLASQITPGQLYDSHLIVVGKPGSLSLFKDLVLPVAFDGQNFALANVQPSDGIIQLATSPWNPELALLYVGSASDEGIIKAGKALQTDLVVFNGNPGVAVVAQAQRYATSPDVTTDRTFEQIGYPKETLDGIGLHRRSFGFLVPPGMVVQENAYLDLAFSHSSLLDYWRSGLVVSLNGSPIGSVRLSDETSQTGASRLEIYPADIRPGYNLLTVETNLAPRDYCSEAGFGNTWLTLLPSSNLHIPYTSDRSILESRSIDLSSFPSLFSLSPSKGQIGFVLTDSATSWKTAISLAAVLGNPTGWGFPAVRSSQNPLTFLSAEPWGQFDFQAIYGTEITEELKGSHDLILVGQASALPSLGIFGDNQPLQFESGQDNPSQTGLPVIYRSSPGSAEGFLELLQAPSVDQTVVLAVLGNSPEGLLLAAHGLTDPEKRSQLSGSYALLHGEQVISGLPTTAGNPGEVEAGGEEPDAPSPDSQPQPGYRPAWLLPLIGTLLIAMAVVSAAAVVANRRQQELSE